MKNKGVTLVELLLVIVIISLITVPAASLGSNLFIKNDLRSKTKEVVSSLRTAQINAMVSKGDSPWGVTAQNNQIVLFMGADYASRDQRQDLTFDIPGSVSITPFEVVYAKVTGSPAEAANIIITSSQGVSNTVSVNAVGTVDVN